MKSNFLRRAGLLAGLFITMTAFDFLDDEAFHCEQVAAHLDDCCGDALYATELDCNYGACSSPTFTSAELSCLARMSCKEITEENICERALEPLDDEFASRGLCQ